MANLQLLAIVMHDRINDNPVTKTLMTLFLTFPLEYNHGDCRAEKT